MEKTDFERLKSFSGKKRNDFVGNAIFPSTVCKENSMSVNNVFQIKFNRNVLFFN